MLLIGAHVAVPPGIFTGWNLRAAGVLAPLDGMMLPFVFTRTGRERAGDPRPAVRERYPTREAYLARMTDAAIELRRERFLLDEDVSAILQRAAER